jgi:predicted nuclease of predicted toxin-antitoxin system
MARTRIKFFIDQCVPDSVGRVLAARGHEVVLLREVLPTDAPDQVVAATAERSGAVLVSFDSDFKALAARMGMGRRRFNKLSRVSLGCREPEAAKRIESALTLIEHEWRQAKRSRDKRIIVEILGLGIKTIR